MSQKRELTIHRALAELKLIDSKIESNLKQLHPLGIYQLDKLVDGLSEKKKFEDNAKSKYDSIKSLISDKLKIKTAIIKKNAEVEVVVAGVKMTIAEAITEKSNIELKKGLLQSLKLEWNKTVSDLNRKNELARVNLEKFTEAVLGKDNVKSSESEVKALREMYLKANEYHLCDPIGLEKIIEDLGNEIAKFESEVDAVLSEANAINKIEI